MRVIARKPLKDFSDRYSDSKNHLDAWFAEVKHAQWSTPAEVKKSFPMSRIVGKDRIIFNIVRNKYRLIVKINYKAGIVFIRFIGTHKEYDRINVEEI